MDHASIERCQHAINVDLATLNAAAAEWGFTAGQLLAGAVCLCHTRLADTANYTLGLARDGAVWPVAISVDTVAPAREALDAIVRTLADAQADSDAVGRSYALLLGTAQDEDVLAAALATGNTAVEIGTEPMPGADDDSPAVRSLFCPPAHTAQQMHCRHLQLETFLAGLLAHPQWPVAALPLASQAEHDVIARANDTAIGFSDDRCIHERFEDVVRRSPDAPALVYRGETLTYDGLNRMANRLARALQQQGAGPGAFVPIACSRGFGLIAAMLAVLKTGAAFVPLSLQYPAAFLGMIVQQSGARLIVTDDADLPGTLPGGLACVDPGTVPDGDDADLPRPCGLTPASTAALIFTSGTTGRPKGVLVRHNTVVNYGEFNVREFHIDAADAIMQFAPFPFSTAILEITAPLFAGARLCLVPDAAVGDPRAFYQEMMQAQATILLAPPGYVGYLPVPPTMRIIETGAAECTPAISAKIVAATRHVNAYGLTEGCVPLVWRGCDGPRPATIPLGRPVANTQAHILDEAGRECALYVPGELCVTGLCVSDGYLGDPQRTAQRFVPNPFGTGTMLRTGDIARWNGDGDIEYVGRTDNQVKIRGMRVELEEVERTLVQLSGVTGAAVIARPAATGDLQLAGFVTPASCDAADLRRQLYDRLPEHKVPSLIVALDQLPMTPNGKVDKAALDAAVPGRIEDDEPSGPAEQLVTRAFEQVLNLSGLGAHADFFALGGHSLSAAMALNRVEELAGVRLDLADLFAHPTVAQFATAVQDACDRRGVTLGTPVAPVPRAPRSGRFPMSPAQRRIYLTCQAGEVGTAYNIPVALQFDGILDAGRVGDVLTALADRHAGLRTSFSIATDDMADALAVQDVAEPGQVRIDVDTVTLDPDDTAESLLAAFVRPFDLACAPLLRARVGCSDTRSVLLIDVHHLIADGATLQHLLDEFCRGYNGEALTPDPYQYPDFSQWAAQRDLSAQRAYWADAFETPPDPLNLVTDTPRPPLPSYTGGEALVTLDAAFRTALEGYARCVGATPFMVMAATLMAVLGRYTGQTDIALGTPVAGRSRREFEDVVGMFVNTVVLRGHPEPQRSFADFLASLVPTCLDGFANQDFPYEQLVDALALPRDLSRNPLFDVCFTFQNTAPVTAALNGLPFAGATRAPLPAQFDLSFEVSQDDAAYQVRLAYRTPLFCAASAQLMLAHYCTALRAVVADPSVALADLPLADAAEQTRVLDQFSGAPVPSSPEPACVVTAFQAQARRQPDHVALALGEDTLTYGELDARADRIAGWLLALHVGRDDLVAVRAGRGFAYVTAVLGVLKAGAGILPIDDAMPARRARFLMDDSGAKALLTSGDAPQWAPDVPRLDVHGELPATHEPDRTPAIGPDDVAYCIYTSGSTGTPKGVLVTHGNLANLAGFNAQLGLGPSDTVLQFATCSFDVSMWEVSAALTTGATLRLLPPDIARDPDAVREVLAGCTVSFLPPGYVPLVRPAGLRALVTAGGLALPETVRQAVLNDTYVNAYGPTETTIFGTAWWHRNGEDIRIPAPIGRPMPGYTAYVLDGLRPCPIGVPGELCLGGYGIARGYLNRPDLTAAKFIDNPFGPGRLNRTGDIARWLPDGNLEFLGRVDNQVKIRGYRVEPGEIEAALVSLDEVDEAAVVVNDSSLVAYLGARPNIDTTRIRAQLAQTLPDYMLPGAIVALDALPRNAGGKVDRHRLPAPGARAARHADPEAPHSREEALLAWVFGEVLDTGAIGVQDNFFELGGNSLLVIKAINRVESITGVRLPVAAWFTTPTVAGLADALQAHQADTAEAVGAAR